MENINQKYLEKERNNNLSTKYDKSIIRQSFKINKNEYNEYNSNNKEKKKFKGENKIKYNDLIKHKLLMCDSLNKRKNTRTNYD